MLLEIKNVSKSFGTMQVLKNVNMQVEKGEIHSLLGLNGAGKSTLVNIISGLYTEFEGDIIFDGENINQLSVLESQKKGIYMVPQHAAIVDEYTLAENIFIGNWPMKNQTVIDRKSMLERAQVLLNEYGVNISAEEKAGNLSLIDKRKLNIIRALYSNAKLIILDEPTTSLSTNDRKELFYFVRNLSAKGTSFIFISHYLNEVLELSDNITVLRDGCAYRDESGERTEDSLSKLIVGSDVTLMKRTPGTIREDYMLECEDLTGEGVDHISFSLHTGEIIGLIGHPGSGVREMVQMLYGIRKASGGKLRMKGKDIPLPKKTYDAMEQRIIYIPNDRHKDGLVSIMSIAQNISLGILNLKLRKTLGVLDEKVEAENIDRYYDVLKIKASSPQQAVGELSGGNQQKVVVAKAMCCEPEVLILDEPTIGIDVHTREEIMKLVDKMTTEGKAILYITNDYSELLRICDRVVAFKDGKIIHNVENHGLSIEEVMEMRDS